jgi:hypothetical protein
VFLKVRCVAHLNIFKRYALIPVVKNRVSSEASRQVAQAVVNHRLPPIIGMVSHPVFRTAKYFEYWSLALLWSLKFVSLEFLSQPPDLPLFNPFTKNFLQRSFSVNNFTHARPELLMPITDWCRPSANLYRPLIQGRSKTQNQGASTRNQAFSSLIKVIKGFS